MSIYSFVGVEKFQKGFWNQIYIKYEVGNLIKSRILKPWNFKCRNFILL